MPDNLREVDLFPVQDNLPAHDSRNVQQIVDQTRQVTRLAIDDGTGPLDFSVARRMPSQDLHRAANRRERIPKLMPEHGEELIFALIHVAQRFLDGAIRPGLLERGPDRVCDTLHECHLGLAPVTRPGFHH